MVIEDLKENSNDGAQQAEYIYNYLLDIVTGKWNNKSNAGEDKKEEGNNED